MISLWDFIRASWMDILLGLFIVLVPILIAYGVVIRHLPSRETPTTCDCPCKVEQGVKAAQ